MFFFKLESSLLITFSGIHECFWREIKKNEIFGKKLNDFSPREIFLDYANFDCKETFFKKKVNTARCVICGRLQLFLSQNYCVHFIGRLSPLKLTLIGLRNTACYQHKIKCKKDYVLYWEVLRYLVVFILFLKDLLLTKNWPTTTDEWSRPSIW